MKVIASPNLVESYRMKPWQTGSMKYVRNQAPVS